MQEMTLQIESIEKHLGQYQKIEQYSSGSTAVVYKVENEVGDPFCLKVYMDEDVEIFPGETYLKESHLLNVDIPYTARVYNVEKYVEDGKEVHYSVMEFVSGVHLFDYINTEEYDSHFVKDLANRLYEANNHLLDRNLGHRDISTSNILVTNEGSSVLIDFGMVSKTNIEEFTFEESAFFYQELDEIIGLPEHINYEALPTYWRMITLFEIKRVINDVIIKKNRTTYKDIKIYLNLEHEIRMLASGNKKHVALFTTCRELLKFFRRIYCKLLYFKK